MSKAETKQIKEAPGYLISSDCVIINEKTGKAISESKGNVRLSIDGKRRSFDVKKIFSEYFPPMKKKKSTKAIEASKQKRKNLSNNKSLTEEDRQKIRDIYDKNVDSFSISATAKKFDISYGRVWGIIKTHQKNQKAKK